MLLEGKVAVVAGGASGIGRAVGLAFGRHGAAGVVVADVRDCPRDGGQPAHRLIRKVTDAESRFVRCDVRSVDQLHAAVEVAEELGGIDVMVNCAGIYWKQDLLETAEEDYDRMMSVNVKGAYFGAQAAARRMIARGDGVIINIGSGSGILGSAGFTVYCATKGALRTMTFAQAAELGPHGIRVNIIEPWHIETSMIQEDVPEALDEAGESVEVRTAIPMRRPGKPEDVANAAVYLASDLASYVTASEFFVDGGRIYTTPTRLKPR